MKNPTLVPDSEKMSYMFLSLLTEKVKVLVVGGGKAALIKVKSFLARGCRVTGVAPVFREEFTTLDSEDLHLQKGSYECSQLSGQHLVVIATNDEAVNRKVQNDCEQAAKLYLTCSDYRNGQFVTPIMRESDEALLALHTKVGSPRTSVFLAEKLQEQLRSYDCFIRFACELRQKLKGRDDKNQIMKRVNSDEFFKVFMEGKYHELVKTLLEDKNKPTKEPQMNTNEHG
jgi:precorrin-2 dehydrogenase / sirohydrochlorin ferrochelatase